ncbi:MAG: LacI family DNA-binding transcriptional regulator [Devosiaceae bacterium]
MILSNIQNNFFAAVAWELERLLSQSGRAMLLYTSNEDPDIQDRCLEDIRARQVSGVFFLCATNSPRLQDFVTSGPVVFINRRIASLPDVSFVGIDDRAAARELMETMLRRQGEQSFGLIHGPLSSDTSSRRLEGMLAACKEAGMEISSNHIREANLSMEGGYEAACSLLANKPLATLFCGNDQIGYGAYRRCRELGLRVPDEIAIYGFDDNPLNEWLAPWLNTVRVPHLSFAKTAIDQMQRLVDGHDAESLTIPYQVILRS